MRSQKLEFPMKALNLCHLGGGEVLAEGEGWVIGGVGVPSRGADLEEVLNW